MSKRKTTEQFIEESKLIYGNKYKYDKVNYVNSITAVEIYCNKCEKYFEKKPINFLINKQGCPVCGIEERNKKKTNTTEEFIEKAKLKFGDRYDYSSVVYEYNKTPVKFKCNKHNYWFEQKPFNFLQGYGCPICGKESRKENCIKISKRKTQEEFLKEVEDNKGYDYSLVKYINDKTKVKIICKNCNSIFEQKPNNHLNGQGCPYCHGGILKTQKKFLEQLKEIHRDCYDCSLVKYVNDKTKVELICNKCYNHFYSIPTHLLNGSGCPYCKESKGEKAIRLYLEKNNIKFEKYKTYEGLVDIKKLSYDFYLPDYNLLIEYNGIQHYKWTKKFQPTLHSFHKQLHHDWLKRKYSRDNNINLLVIKYTELKQIDKKINL